MKQFILIFLLLCSTTAVLGQSKALVVGSQEYTLQEKKVKVSPNPATVEVQIKSESNLKITNVSVYSIIGSEVLNKSFDKKNELTLNVQNLKKGKYMVRVQYENGLTEVTTLIKQ